MVEGSVGHQKQTRKLNLLLESQVSKRPCLKQKIKHVKGTTNEVFPCKYIYPIGESPCTQTQEHRHIEKMPNYN